MWSRKQARLVVREPPCYSYSENLTFMVYGGIQMTRHLFIHNIRRIARLFPTVHYALNLRDAARNEFERNVERRYDFMMQEETEVLGENLCGQVWIENQIHTRLWPDWESNPGRIGERHGNNHCASDPPAQPALTWCQIAWTHQKHSYKHPGARGQSSLVGLCPLAPRAFLLWPLIIEHRAASI